jgi:Methyltransferase domain
VKEYWEKNVTEEFQKSLYGRRRRQAKLILNLLEKSVHLSANLPGKTVDYGCGLGAMVSVASGAGVSIIGCDLSVPSRPEFQNELWRQTNFRELSEPWEIDDTCELATCVLLLDVLEHHPTPIDFIARFKNARCVVLKVPNANGPLATVASLLFPVTERPYDRLSLIDDIAPHLWNFTSKGLDDVMSRNGFMAIASLRLAEFGVEASGRARGTGPFFACMKPLLYIAGGAFAILSKFWSETTVRVYWQSNQPARTWIE